MGQLFRMELLQEIAETTFFTASLENENPLSILFVGPSGAAKTKLIQSYKSPFFHITDSVTSKGLYDVMKGDPSGKIKFIMVPDLNPTLSRKPSTAQATIANLLSITCDGTVRIDDGREHKECAHRPIGFVSACAPEIYDKNARKWFALGLRRRIIPIFFSYTQETINALQKETRNGRVNSGDVEANNLKFPSRMVRPEIPAMMKYDIEKLSIVFARNLGKIAFVAENIRKWTVREVLPISPQVTLQNLAMAHALRARRSRVLECDISFLNSFVEFTDHETPRKI